MDNPGVLPDINYLNYLLMVGGLLLGFLIQRAIRSQVRVTIDLNQTIQMLNEERKSFVEERRTMEAERHAQQVRIGDLEMQAAEIPALKKRLAEACLAVDQQGAEIVKMKATHRSEVGKLQELYDAEQRARVALQDRVTGLESENATLKGERELLITKVDELEKKLAERDEHVAALTSKVEELQKRGTGPLAETNAPAPETTADASAHASEESI